MLLWFFVFLEIMQLFCRSLLHRFPIIVYINNSLPYVIAFTIVVYRLVVASTVLTTAAFC